MASGSVPSVVSTTNNPEKGSSVSLAGNKSDGGKAGGIPSNANTPKKEESLAPKEGKSGCGDRLASILRNGFNPCPCWQRIPRLNLTLTAWGMAIGVYYLFSAAVSVVNFLFEPNTDTCIQATFKCRDDSRNDTSATTGDFYHGECARRYQDQCEDLITWHAGFLIGVIIFFVVDGGLIISGIIQRSAVVTLLSAITMLIPSTTCIIGANVLEYILVDALIATQHFIHLPGVFIAYAVIGTILNTYFAVVTFALYLQIRAGSMSTAVHPGPYPGDSDLSISGTETTSDGMSIGKASVAGSLRKGNTQAPDKK